MMRCHSSPIGRCSHGLAMLPANTHLLGSRHAPALHASVQCQRVHSARAAGHVWCQSSRVDRVYGRQSRKVQPDPEDTPYIDVTPEREGEPNMEQRMQIIRDIVQTKSYPEMKAVMMKWSKEMEGEVAVYALMQAARLRSMLGIDVMGEMDRSQAMVCLDAVAYVVTTLVPHIERQIHDVPAGNQITIVSALSQLDHYNENIFTAVAQTCTSLGDATGGMAEAVALSPGGAPQSDTVALQLLMISSAYALVAHLDDDLFDLIARQTVEQLGNIQKMPVLINILAAFMDVSCPNGDLLEGAMSKLSDNISGITPNDAATVLLIYSYFQVKDDEFYQRFLQVASRMDPDTLDPKSVAALYRAVHLIGDMPADLPAIQRLFDQALAQFGPLQLSVLSPNVPNLQALSLLEKESGTATQEFANLMISQKMYDIMIRSDVNLLLTKSSGLKTLRNHPVTSDGWLLAHVAVPDMAGHKIAFMVLNPDKYCNNSPAQIRGLAKSELMSMEGAGWSVVPISAREFNVIGTTANNAGENQAQVLLAHLEDLTRKHF